MNKHRNNSPHRTSSSPFVKLMIEIIDAPAWRAMSHGAKSLYIALRRRYNAIIDNNGKIYLPQRVAQKELRSKRDQIARWFRELQHYGFIVMVSPGYLGLNGHGRAARWRLTELSCNKEQPTKNFLAWNGVAFGERKTESRSRKEGDQEEAFSKSSSWSRKGDQRAGPEKGTKSRFI